MSTGKHIYHIVEHGPRGTIFGLCKSLHGKDDQRLIYMPEAKIEFNELKFGYKDCIYVIHTTGRGTEILERCVELLQFHFVFLFLHVSPDYMRYMKRDGMLSRFVLYQKLGVRFLVPCIAIKDQLSMMGINSAVVQMGISQPTIRATHLYDQYKNRIITCCSEDTDEYRYVKGIDLFESFVVKNKLQDDSLIVGASSSINSIECCQLSHDEFMVVLSTAKVYVQFSRFEAYNVTAMEAKRLKIPVVLLDVEGVGENVKYGCVCKNVSEMEHNICKVIREGYSPFLLEKNYLDSASRENVDVFAAQIRYATS